METSGPQMEAIEAISREKGISYEELTREAIDHFLSKQKGEEREEEDDNEGEEWKQ